jgi:selenide,water dikinase
VAPALAVAPGVEGSQVALAHDPQTSGGLLAAIAPDRLVAVEQGFVAAGVTSWRIGRVEAAEVPGVVLA